MAGKSWQVPVLSLGPEWKVTRAEATWTPKELQVELQQTGRIPLRCPHLRRGVPGLRDAVPRVVELFSRMCSAVFAIAFCGACEGSSAGFAQPAYFQASDSAYVIRSVDARVGQGETDAEFDETQVLFGSILDSRQDPIRLGGR